MVTLCFDRDRCAQYAADVLGQSKTWGEWFQCIGVEDNGQLCGVAVFNDYTRDNIEMTVATTGRGWAARRMLRAVFRYPFEQLNVSRVTAHVRESNRKALKVAKAAGFREEGRQRRWFGDETAVVLGLLREDLKL
jgi:RimJ/RimL family protein N-acetyltransferase